MQAGWLIHEAAQRTMYCHFPPLVATRTNGDNGGRSRNTSPQANFWRVFYRNLLQRIRDNQSQGIRPCLIDHYLDRHGADGEVKLRPRAWNTGRHDGSGFTQWISSSTPQRTLTRPDEINQAIYATHRNAVGISVRHPDVYLLLSKPTGRFCRPRPALVFRSFLALSLVRGSRGHAGDGWFVDLGG